MMFGHRYAIVRSERYEAGLAALNLPAHAIHSLEEAIDYLLSREPRSHDIGANRLSGDFYVASTEMFYIEGSPDVSFVYLIDDEFMRIELLSITIYQPLSE